MLRTTIKSYIYHRGEEILFMETYDMSILGVQEASILLEYSESSQQRFVESFKESVASKSGGPLH